MSKILCNHKLLPDLEQYVPLIRYVLPKHDNSNWLLHNQAGTAVHIWVTDLLKMIYHPLYGMNNYVLIWGDWLSCDPLRRSHDSQSPHIRKTLVPHLVAILIYLSQIYSYYIRGDRSSLTSHAANTRHWAIVDGGPTLNQQWLNVSCWLGWCEVTLTGSCCMGQ